MPFDPARHHRRSIRLRDYDYAGGGCYFVTICAYQWIHMFGDVVDGTMWINACGRIAHGCWYALPDHFPTVVLDAFVVMPNHIHGVIGIANTPVVGATHASPLRFDTPPSPSFDTPPSSSFAPLSSPSLGVIVGSFKSAVTKHINRKRGTPGGRVWQRNFYEHIIRNERALSRIRRYIIRNSQRWPYDRNNHD